MARWHAAVLALAALAAWPDLADALWRDARDPTRDPDAVLLADVKSLVLKRGERTTARRGRSVAQLHCVGGPCGTENEPEVVLCEQAGTDYTSNDPLWKCSATLPSGLRLGVTDVSCEGFRYAEDPYVLRGSCGLEYTIAGTPATAASATTTTTTTAAGGGGAQRVVVPAGGSVVREIHHVHHIDQPAAPTLFSWFTSSRKDKPATAARIDVVQTAAETKSRSSSSSWLSWLLWGALAWAAYRWWFAAPARSASSSSYAADRTYYTPPRRTAAAAHATTTTTTTGSNPSAWSTWERRWNDWHGAGDWRGWNNWSAWRPASAATREFEAKDAGYVPERAPGNPGFWGGAGLGALAGYWLGQNRGAAYERHRRRNEAPYTGVYDRGPFENQPVAPATAAHPGQPATVLVEETVETIPVAPPPPPPPVESTGYGVTKRR